MNKWYGIIVVVIAVCIIGGFLVIRSNQMKTFSVSDMSTQTNVVEENTAQQPFVDSDGMKVADQISGNGPETAQQKIDVADTSVVQEKSMQDTPAKGVNKESNQKKPETVLKLDIHNKLVSFGFSVPSKPRNIDTIILHSSHDSVGDDPYSIDGIIDIYKGYGVSAHYLLARDGGVYRLVKDEDIAYHAGVSKVPDGRTQVNDFSIGIEIVNTKTGEYTDAQYVAVKKLIASLKEKYTIKYILGHDDIAPDRKSDPWNFDWKKL